MNIFSLSLYQGEYDTFLELIKDPKVKILVFTPNPEMLVKAQDDEEFLSLLKSADYLTPDANGLYTASLIQEGKGYIRALFATLFQKGKLVKKYGELIPGSALTKDLVDFAMRENHRILMIDNYRISDPKNAFEVRKKEIQENFSLLFREKFPNLMIDIFFDGEKSNGEIADHIKKNDIRYVFSCIGMKSQEKRLFDIFSSLPASQKVVGLGVGSSFDYLLGLQKRAPRIIRKMGLEWLFRLLQDPIGRWKRIQTALVDFPKRVMKNTI